MRSQLAGVELSRLITTVCGHFRVEHQELLSGAKGREVAQARPVLTHMATWDFPFSRSEVARRLRVGRSAVSRAVRRVGNDPDLLETARVIRATLSLLETGIRQH